MNQDRISLPSWWLAAGGLILLNVGLGIGWAMARHAAKTAPTGEPATEAAPVAAPSMPDEQQAEALLRKVQRDDPDAAASVSRVLGSPLAIERLRQRLTQPPQP